MSPSTAHEVSVVHVIDGLGTGGAERSMAELLPALESCGVRSTVVCSHLRHEGVHQRIVESGIPVHVMAATSMAMRVRELRALLQRLAPDLVHATLLESNLISRLASTRLAPVLSSLVNTPYAPHRLADPALSTAKVRAVQAADMVTAHSLTARFHALTQAVKESAVRNLRLRPERIEVIPRGREERRLGPREPARRSAIRADLGLVPDELVLINVGRQEYQKGQTHLLDATAQLLKRGVKVRTLIAGRTGNATPNLLAQRRRLGLEEQVAFLGHRDDVPDLLSASDVFVFPSLFEGFGGAVVEAMAMNVPIVAADVPAVREVLADGAVGRLVPAGDGRRLAEAVAASLAAPAATRHQALRARRRYLDHYTIAAVVDKTRRLYEDMVPTGPGNWSRPS